MPNNKTSVTFVEVSLVFVVLTIVAVIALPALPFSSGQSSAQVSTNNSFQAIDKVQSAYAHAIAHADAFPQLSQVVDFINADFASEKNDLSGIVFAGQEKPVMVNTYNDESCTNRTSGVNPGVSDIVRCISPGVDA